MNTKQTISIFALLIFQLPVALAQWDVRNYPGSNFDGPAFVFEEVAPDIYQARGAENLMVGSNAAIIVNDDGVVVIDSNISPVAAAALAEELKAITDKPIKYVINTHFQFDHAHGNQIYPAAVQIIGHEFTYLIGLTMVVRRVVPMAVSANGWQAHRVAPKVRRD